MAATSFKDMSIHQGEVSFLDPLFGKSMAERLGGVQVQCDAYPTRSDPVEPVHRRRKFQGIVDVRLQLGPLFGAALQ